MPPAKRRPKHHLDQAAQDYCQTLAEMWELCEEHQHNFREEMMRLAEQWIDQHPRKSDPRKPDPDAKPNDG